MGYASCPLCAENRTHGRYSCTNVFGINDVYEVCAGCGTHVLRNDREAVDTHSYGDSYYGVGATKFVDVVEILVRRRFRSMRVRRIVRLNPEKRAVLDIGCGDGGFLEGVAQAGISAFGVEPPGRALDRARSITSIEVFEGPVSKETLGDRTFGVVTLWHVFEHLPDPLPTLDLIGTILDLDGTLVMALPNICSLQASIFGRHWFHLDPPHHLFLPTRGAVIDAVERHGFRLTSEKHFSLEQNVFGYIQSLLNTVSKRRELLYERLKGQRLSGLFDNLVLVVHIGLSGLLLPIAIVMSLVEAALRRGGTIELTFNKIERP